MQPGHLRTAVFFYASTQTASNQRWKSENTFFRFQLLVLLESSVSPLQVTPVAHTLKTLRLEELLWPAPKQIYLIYRFTAALLEGAASQTA